MMGGKGLEQEYRRLKRQQAPDLWNRIEENLSEHPERNRMEEDPSKHLEQNRKEEKDLRNVIHFPKHRICGLATVAAAMLVLLIAGPRLMNGRFEKSGNGMPSFIADKGAPAEAAPEVGAAAGAAGEASETEMAAGAAGEASETGMAAGAAGETSETRAAAGAAEAARVVEADMGAPQGRTGAVREADLSEEDMSGKEEQSSGMAGVSNSGAEAEGASNNGLTRNFLSGNAGAPSKNRVMEALPDGILSYDQLDLAASQPLVLPENTVTAEADSRYFSEDILRDAQLLCSGTVTEVSLEQDESGRTVKVVYEMTLDRVYFAEDYMTGTERMTVKSPIVRTEGDQVYILYQLQPGGTYLLPLHRPEQDWELLYPFAPQIQVTGKGAYLFHSGYVSLMNEDTSVVIGSPEGSNDYFYDRMVLRDDEKFLSDLLALIEN